MWCRCVDIPHWQDTSTTLLLAPSLSRADWTWLPGTRQRQALASRQVPGTTGHTRSQCSASVPSPHSGYANQISSAGCWRGWTGYGGYCLIVRGQDMSHRSGAALLHFYQLPTVNSPVSALCTAHGPVLTLSTYQHAGFHSPHMNLQCRAGCWGWGR